MDARENYCEGISQYIKEYKLQFAFAHRVARSSITSPLSRDETLKSHFNEKGKSRITALPLPDDGAVPAGTGNR